MTWRIDPPAPSTHPGAPAPARAAAPEAGRAAAPVVAVATSASAAAAATVSGLENLVPAMWSPPGARASQRRREKAKHQQGTLRGTPCGGRLNLACLAAVTRPQDVLRRRSAASHVSIR